MLNINMGDLVFRSTKLALVWLVVRLYVGWAWFDAALSKIGNVKWTGEEAGSALTGFVNGALQKTGGAHPDVQGWYAAFLQNVVLQNAEVFSYLVTFGELLVGIGLLLGALTGIAAFFGVTMNLSYLLSGAVSTNPILLILGILLVLAWRVAGHYGLDRFLIPKLRDYKKTGA